MSVMMIFTVVALSSLIFILLMILANVTSRCAKKDSELLKKNEELNMQLLINLRLRSMLTSKPNTTSDINANAQIKEAVFYAVKASHPDNGGRSEDFIKFKKLYDSMK